MPDLSTRALLASHSVHPLVLDFFLLKHLGPEYYGWEPETLWAEAKRVARAPNISETNRNKVQALLTVHKTDAPFERWEVFEKVIMALNSIVPRFDVMQKPDLGQLVFGVRVMLQLRSGTFSDEVARYVAAVFLTDGLIFAPEPLSFANPILLGHVPSTLHKAIEAALASGKPHEKPAEDEALSIQLAKIQEAKVYSAEASRRLLEQLKVVQDESGHDRSLPR